MALKIGVMVESFRKDFRYSIETAAKIGAAGVQKYATGGEIDWTEAQIKEALDIVKSNGLVFSAICGDFGHGFMDPEQNKIYVLAGIHFARKTQFDLAKWRISFWFAVTTRESISALSTNVSMKKYLWATLF